MTIGPAVKEVSVSFDLYWNSELAYPATTLKGGPATSSEIDQMRQHLDEFVAKQTDSDYLEALRNSTLANDFKQDQVQFYWGEAEVI